MSKVGNLKLLVKQRLTASADEIFELFERTIAEYEEELCRSGKDDERLRNRLDAVLKPDVRLHRTGSFTSPLTRFTATTVSSGLSVTAAAC